MKPRAVIFDFGGVLVRTLDPLPRRALEQRLNLLPGESEEIVFGGPSGAVAQLGLIREAEHWRWVRERLSLDDEGLEDFRDRFFAGDRLDERLVAYLRRLRGYFKVGILSNAMSGARQSIMQSYGLAECVDSLTVSAEEGVMKPHPRIYLAAAQRLGVPAGEALFVDDMLPNVMGAEAVGMQGLHFVDAEAALEHLAAVTGIERVECVADQIWEAHARPEPGLPR